MIACSSVSRKLSKAHILFKRLPNLSNCPDERKEGHRATDHGHINFTQRNFNNAVAENKEPDH